MGQYTQFAHVFHKDIFPIYSISRTYESKSPSSRKLTLLAGKPVASYYAHVVNVENSFIRGFS